MLSRPTNFWILYNREATDSTICNLLSYLVVIKDHFTYLTSIKLLASYVHRTFSFEKTLKFSSVLIRTSSLLQLAPLEAVLFDIDGTLCDSDPLHYYAFREMLQEVRSTLRFCYSVSVRCLHGNSLTLVYCEESIISLHFNLDLNDTDPFTDWL